MTIPSDEPRVNVVSTLARRNDELTLLQQNNALEELEPIRTGVEPSLPLPSYRISPETRVESANTVATSAEQSPPSPESALTNKPAIKKKSPSTARRYARSLLGLSASKVGPRSIAALLALLLAAGLLAFLLFLVLPFGAIASVVLALTAFGVLAAGGGILAVLIRRAVRRLHGRLQAVERSAINQRKILRAALQKETRALEASLRTDTRILESSLRSNSRILESSLRSNSVALSSSLKAVASRVGGLEAAIGKHHQAVQEMRPDLDELKQALSAADSELQGMKRSLGALQSMSQSMLLWRPDSPEKQRSLLHLARHFVPHAAVGFEKRRVGRLEDGGYVMLDDFGRVGGAISAGVGDDSSWDCEMAELCIPIIQFDHTIESAPKSHPNLTFRRERIVPADSVMQGISLDRIVASDFPTDKPLILKMDIEGDEWAVLEGTSSDTLQRFSQVVCEFHDFHHAAETEWYERALHVATKMSEIFEVVHVHGNNFAELVCIGNVVLPRVLEVTFASRRYYEFTKSDEIFPTSLDWPNRKGVADHFLGRFQF